MVEEVETYSTSYSSCKGVNDEKSIKVFKKDV
jgi:hypothetical protein